MIKQIKSKTYNYILIICGFIFLVFSPWMNKDSMVVPKVVLLFCLAMFLLPSIVFEAKTKIRNGVFKALITISLLIVFQMVVTVISSEAPIEQQIFGKMGRGLGFLTLISLIILTLAASFYANNNNLKFLLILIVIVFSVSSFYSILQSFGLDIIKWETRTNAVFGTLGNPNFQAAAAAMVLVPCILVIKRDLKTLLIGLSLVFLNLYAIYRTVSVQGFIGSAIGISFLILFFLFYKNKHFFVWGLVLVFTTLFLSILAMLNQGPLKGLSIGPFTFYKPSVQSRGDFWRSAFEAAKDHPFFGVGIDSFGDYFMEYRDEVAVGHTFSEFTDNSHNYFLEYAVTGGIPLMLLHTLIVFLTVSSFVKIVRKTQKFEPRIAALFAFWLVFQAQSFISPGSISLMIFNSIVTGSLIGISQFQNLPSAIPNTTSKKLQTNRGVLNIFFALLAILFIFPYFNSDRIYLNALNSRNGDLLVATSKAYPESTLRYSTSSRLLLESKLYEQSLDVARSAIEFNPRNVSPWAHILLNPVSTLREKEMAKNMLIKLDPNNGGLKEIKIEG